MLAQYFHVCHKFLPIHRKCPELFKTLQQKALITVLPDMKLKQVQPWVTITDLPQNCTNVRQNQHTCRIKLVFLAPIQYPQTAYLHPSSFLYSLAIGKFSTRQPSINVSSFVVTPSFRTRRLPNYPIRGHTEIIKIIRRFVRLANSM